MEELQKRGVDLKRVVTHRLPIAHLPKAFEQARSPESVKVVVVHSAKGS
jgi:threonine dehydrogenase-like Zn-dependent dehydrogenase